jgi:hypothetical protein
MERIMSQRVNYQHRSKGWLFETGTGGRAKFGRYNATFHSLVALARAMNSQLVPHAIKLEDFSLWQSPGRGAVLETMHWGVDSKVMELVNRWRSKEGAKGSVPNLPMRQVYTGVQSTLPTMLKYSRALWGRGRKEGKCWSGGVFLFVLSSVNLTSSETPIHSSILRHSNQNTGYWEYRSVGICGKVQAVW